MAEQPSVISGALKRPFAEQVAFFRAKLGNLVPTAKWDDIKGAAHDTKFMVAGAKGDLLADMYSAVERSISEGKGLEVFRKNFMATVERRGWKGFTGDASPAQRAWRTKVIYQTNMATSYAAGRYAQLKEDDFKLWVYHHNDSTSHPRPLHVSWNGVALPPEHPFWSTHYPPKVFGCRCYVSGTNSAAGVSRLGGDPDKPLPEGWDAIDPKTGEQVGIGKGWGYAPGASVSKQVSMLAKKLESWPAPIGARAVSGLGEVGRKAIQQNYQEWLAVAKVAPPKGEQGLLGAMAVEELAFLQGRGKEPGSAGIVIADRLVSGKKAVRHILAGDGLSEAEWAALPGMVAQPEAVLFDTSTGNLLYVAEALTDDRKIKVVVEVDAYEKKLKKQVNQVATVFKVGGLALQDKAKYEVVRGGVR